MARWKQILIAVIAVLLGSYLVFSIIYFHGKHEQPDCSIFTISFSDADERQFVSAEEMRQFVLRSGLNPEKIAITEKRCHQIEQLALQHPMIRTATCYSTPSGQVVLRLSQRVPMLRVLGADNYFVDSDRRIMPVRSTTASDVPVLTGRIAQHDAQGCLYDFVEWLEDDGFWSAQVAQINVAGPNRIELIPRVGSGVIILGNLDEYPQKLRKLKALYQRGFAKFGWKEYKEIDLRFRGQIVCR